MEPSAAAAIGANRLKTGMVSMRVIITPASVTSPLWARCSGQLSGAPEAARCREKNSATG